jgi:YD repeat-containing protein
MKRQLNLPMPMKSKPNALRVALWLMLFASLAAWRGTGGNVTFTYDAAGRLTAANYAATTNFIYAYDPAGNLVLASAPVPALIVGPVVDGQMTLYWPVAPAGFILQRATTLASTNAWTDAPVTPLEDGAFFVAHVIAGSHTTFFRLRQGP